MSSKYLTRIFVIEDDPIFGKVIQRTLEQEGNLEVTIFQSGAEFFQNLHLNPDIVTIDYNLPDTNGLDILKKVRQFDPEIGTVIVSGQDKIEVVLESFHHGASNYLMKKDDTLVMLKQIILTLSKQVSLRKEVENLRTQIMDRNRYNTVVGESAAILQVLKSIQKVENNNILVMITGESGTGKEVIANTIHYNSPRRRRPFVAVNVAAIPADLIESELFGHEKGAFTGAIGRRIGKFEEAEGGTIFLDEIGEMELGLQTKLLRVLQENKITRLGSNKEISLDVRVIAATNKNLAQMVKDGLFREDLYYRLQGFLIYLPPLRERENDVVILSKFFLHRFCEQNRIPLKHLSHEAIAKLLEHNWPGNVRELKSVIDRAALISESREINAGDLMFSESAFPISRVA
jgi:DNA-binding NtrC family response regulator